MVVQHNLTAMNSNRMLGITTGTQAKSTEKLSSGYKINRAADDAAGLSISEKMRKQIRGLSQASLNAEDGISAVQTAEGALTEVQDMLQRMNELAVKASNGTMSENDRSYIQDEIEQLEIEIDRVAETTKFNETYLLKGDKNATAKTDFEYKSAKVTAEDMYYIDDEGAVKTLAKGTYQGAKELEDKTFFSTNKPETVGESITDGVTGDYFEAVTIIKSDDLYIKEGNDYKLVNKGEEYDDNETYYVVTFNTDGTIGSAVSTAMDTHTEGGFGIVDGKTVYDEFGNELAADAVLTTTAGYYSSVGDATLGTNDAITSIAYTDHVAQFIDKDGNEIAANGLHAYINEDGTVKEGAGLYVKEGQVATDADVAALVDMSKKYDTGALKLSLHVGADATTNNQISIEIDAMSARSLGVDGIKVDGATDENALNAIETIKEALQKVSTQRSALGAVQNRLEHTIANLDNVVENTTAAESQIRDTDMATEMVKYSNNNILAQAGQAMLAQANQANQGVLSLLG